MNVKHTHLTVYLLLLQFLKAVFSEYVTLTNTVSGDVRGFREKVLEKELDIFLGIPYAVPPVGERRFKRPEMIHPWTGVKDATKFPNACYQVVDTMYDQFEGVDMWNPNTPMSEDCLYLNIWTPTDRPYGELRAVLVWIYGGSFTSGSSSLDVYDGRILASQGDVVVVSINYRLGALGFLYQGSRDIPGNMGLLDQAVALQWIHNNIGQFGGDNRRVTVFGESAGSASTSLLLLSPISKDFVTNVILMSGTASNRWAVDDTRKAKLKFTMLAELVGCNNLDNSSVVDCLRNTQPALLSEKTWDITDGSQVPTPVVPVVDGYFLLESPKKLLASGQFKKSNIMLGSVKDEGTYFLMYHPSYMKYFSLANNEISRETFMETVGAVIDNQNQALTELVSFQYTHPEQFSPNFQLTSQDFIESLDDMISDTAFICPMLEYSDHQTKAGNSVYMYMFNHRTSVNPWPSWMGVMHGYEIDHVFGAPLNSSLQYQPQEKTLSAQIIKYWTNFAKSGNPNRGDGEEEATTEWPQYSLESKDYLILDTADLHTSQGLRDKMCNFWKNIYAPLQSQLSDDWEPCTGTALCPVNFRPSVLLFICVQMAYFFAF